MVRKPRIVIAGTHSGCGKTTVSTGLMAAMARKGLEVQGFKVGPDYIDPMFHRIATARPSRNLDSWMLSKPAIRQIFLKSAAELSIVEGVMGMFDGATPTGEIGSTAYLAKLLKAPMILVVDAKALGRSIAAIVKGYDKFDSKLNVAGVILNRVSGERHFQLLKKALVGYRVFGYLPFETTLKIPQRHLGLIPANELSQTRVWLDAVANAINEHIDLDAIANLAYTAPALDEIRLQRQAIKSKVRIAIARDAAFNFYYEDNLELLRAEGAELVEFSPMSDFQIPQGVGAVVFGGGFPEIFASVLSGNESMRRSLNAAILDGIPVYAECGGLMYLASELVDSEGKAYPMVEALPGRITMTSRLQNFGYGIAEPTHDTYLLHRGERFRGHEFHYSSWDAEGQEDCSLFKVHRRGTVRPEGFCRGKVHASYIHLHWYAARQIPRRLAQAAMNYLKERERTPEEK